VSVSVAIGDREMRVRLGGIDRLLAINGGVTVPLNRIVSASVMPRQSVPVGEGTWLRAPGTHLPGVVRHGSYGREPNRELWAVFGSPEVLVVETDGAEYARIVLRVPDPQRIAAEITAAVDGGADEAGGAAAGS
jgi:hypothetical protein